MKTEKDLPIDHMDSQQKQAVIDEIKSSYKALKRQFPATEAEQEEICNDILTAIFKHQPPIEVDENGNRKNDRLNIYSSDKANSVIITIDVNVGTTPFVIIDPKTDEIHLSHVYLVPQDVNPTHEFYYPSKAEIVDLSKDLKIHIQKGGLLLREIGQVHEPKIKGRIIKMMNNNN